MDIADSCADFPNKKFNEVLGRKAVVMEESLIKPVDETTWYENDQPIREFLESFRKPVILETEEQVEDLSWSKIMKNSIQN
jgi:hypothetical protein